MNDMVAAKLSAVLQVLNGIEVCGKQNLRNLVGCIEFIEQMITELQNGEVKNDG